MYIVAYSIVQIGYTIVGSTWQLIFCFALRTLVEKTVWHVNDEGYRVLYINYNYNEV